MQTLIKGHSSELKAKATELNPIRPAEAYFEKTDTGTNNTYASYIVFISKIYVRIVILANRFYPFNERPVIDYKILQQLFKS